MADVEEVDEGWEEEEIDDGWEAEPPAVASSALSVHSAAASADVFAAQYKSLAMAEAAANERVSDGSAESASRPSVASWEAVTPGVSQGRAVSAVPSPASGEASDVDGWEKDEPLAPPAIAQPAPIASVVPPRPPPSLPPALAQEPAAGGEWEVSGSAPPRLLPQASLPAEAPPAEPVAEPATEPAADPARLCSPSQGWEMGSEPAAEPCRTSEGASATSWEVDSRVGSRRGSDGAASTSTGWSAPLVADDGRAPTPAPLEPSGPQIEPPPAALSDEQRDRAVALDARISRVHESVCQRMSEVAAEPSAEPVAAQATAPVAAPAAAPVAAPAAAPGVQGATPSGLLPWRQIETAPRAQPAAEVLSVSPSPPKVDAPAAPPPTSEALALEQRRQIERISSQLAAAGLGPLGEYVRRVAAEQGRIARLRHKHTRAAERPAAPEAEWWACLLGSLGLEP